MKKTLSLLLVLAMVLSSFSFAFAAEAEKTPGEILKDLGVLTGNAKGDLMLEDELSRQDMVVLLSRVLGQEDEAKAFKGEMSFKDVNDPFYKPYIAWAEANKLTNGVGEGKFGFGRPVTEQEVATLMLRALGYNDVEFKDVPAKAAELKLVDAKADLTVNCKRARMAEITLAALGTKMNGSDKTLAEKLGIELPKPAVVEATKVENVYATNLMEIEVVFNGKVDADSAEEVSNYATNAGTIDYAELSEDMTTVRLTLKEKMANQKDYKLEVLGVKAGDKKVTGELKFAPLDNTLPEVVEVKALGTKAIKVYASEPIDGATASNFKLDGKTYFGTIAVDGRVITLKPYSSTSVLKPGDHTLTVNKLKDFYGLLSLEQTLDFTVVEDNDAPQVVEVSATLEKAVVTFDEDIDPVSASKYNFYWKSGNVKKYPDSVAVSGNKAVLEFDTNRLPAYETKLYVVNVVDYSGNKMAETEVVLNATVDQTRPEVVDVKVSDDAKSIVVKFNKNVKADNKAYYTVKDENGKVVSVKEVTGSGKVYTVVLYKALPEGVNTLSISGVADTTTLKNVMLPFTYQIEIGDTEAPTVASVSANGRQMIISFSETMNLETIANPSNYLIEFAGAWRALPNGTDITPVQNGKAVLIVLPEKIGNTKVAFEEGNVTQIQIMGVKDVAGNILEGYLEKWDLLKATAPAEPVALKAEYGISEQAAFVDENTIKVKFNQGIEKASTSDFAVAGRSIASVEADGSNIVVIKLVEVKETHTTIAKNALTINTENTMKTITGNKVNAKAVEVADLVAPVVVSEKAKLVQDGKKVEIEIEFSEALGGTPANYALDLVVTRLSNNKPLIPLTGYTTTLKADGKTIVIALNEFVEETKYTVAIGEKVNFIEDLAGNNPETTDPIETDAYVAKYVKSNNATLKSLKYGEIEIKLEANKTDYSVELAVGTKEVPQVSAVANHPEAKVEITQAEDLDKNNVATVKVTAEDGTVKTYTVTFTVAEK